MVLKRSDDYVVPVCEAIKLPGGIQGPTTNHGWANESPTRLRGDGRGRLTSANIN